MMFSYPSNTPAEAMLRGFILNYGTILHFIAVIYIALVPNNADAQ